MNELEKEVLKTLEHFNETGELVTDGILFYAAEEYMQEGHVYLKENGVIQDLGGVMETEVRSNVDGYIHTVETVIRAYHTRQARRAKTNIGTTYYTDNYAQEPGFKTF